MRPLHGTKATDESKTYSLRPSETSIVSTERHELLVGSLLSRLTPLQEDDLVGLAGGGRTVGHHHGGPALSRLSHHKAVSGRDGEMC